MTFVSVLAWLTLLVGFPLNALAAMLLYRQHRQAPVLRVLWERFIVAVSMTVLVLFFGLVFVQNDQIPPPLDLDTTKIITRAVMLAVSLITAIGWLWLYATLGRRDVESPSDREKPTV